MGIGAAIGGAAIGGIGSIIGGSLQAGAASDAAAAQLQASQEAIKLQREQFNQTRNDFGPYRQAGQTAILGLAYQAQQPLEYPTYTAPATYNAPVYQWPTEAELQADPGYKFRVQEGQKALERSAAAKGTYLSGGTLKDLTRFGQGLGAQEYANVYARGYQRNADQYARGLQENQDAYTRALQAYNTNYNVMQGLRQTKFGETAAVAGAGQGAVNTLGQLGGQYGGQIAENTIGGGNAIAAGKVGSANALSGAFSGVGNAVNQFTQYQLLSGLLNRTRGGGLDIVNGGDYLG